MLKIRHQSRVRILLIGVIVLMAVSTASAYTIVMRGGKRIEIPDQFLVTSQTVTYEAGTGIQVTLQLAAIDIAATEKANNEMAGAFLRRAAKGNRPVITGEAGNALRTITNRDLEASMVRRKLSEVAYEKRRQELHLPTVAESRKRVEAEAASIQSELKQKRTEAKEFELYWRERARALRAEMTAVDAQLSYLRSRLEEPAYQPLNGFTSISVAPFISTGIGTGHGRFFPRSIGPTRPLVYSAPQLRARIGFGSGLTRGRVLINRPNDFRHGAIGFGVNQIPLVTSVGAFGYPGYDFSYERSALITQFNELATARAGLAARWRGLEDEARRAGAPPGWLRE